jgi:hypothetical protein
VSRLGFTGYREGGIGDLLWDIEDGRWVTTGSVVGGATLTAGGQGWWGDTGTERRTRVETGRTVDSTKTDGAVTDRKKGSHDPLIA